MEYKERYCVWTDGDYRHPVLESRKVDKKGNTIEVVLYYERYDFRATIKVTGKDKGVTMAVHLDKPVPAELVGKAGMNIEFFPATYFGKTYMMDGKYDILPKHPAGNTEIRPLSEKVVQIYGEGYSYSTFDDRGRDEFLVAHPFCNMRCRVCSFSKKPFCISIKIKIFFMIINFL